MIKCERNEIYSGVSWLLVFWNNWFLYIFLGGEGIKFFWKKNVFNLGLVKEVDNGDYFSF